MYFVVFGTDKPGNAKVREENRPTHRIHLRNPGPHPVKVHLGGATLDESGHDMNGTMLVIEADSIDAVRNFLADDPYSRAGLYKTVEIRPWLWGLGNPDDHIKS